MTPIELAGVTGVLFVTVGVGLIVHELTHAMVLRTLGVPYDIELLPDHDTRGLFGAGVSRAWATVTPRSLPRELSPWGLRLAAIAPLAMATPPLLGLVGILPTPVGSDNVFLTAATVAWLGCALPSPQDFSLFWYAGRLLDERSRS